MLELYNLAMPKKSPTLFDDIFSNFASIDLSPFKHGGTQFVTNTTENFSSALDNKSYKSIATANELRLTVDVPGIDPNTIELEVTKNVVSVKGKSSSGKERVNRFTVSNNYDCSTARGEYQFGQVTITIDTVKQEKSQETTKRPITIK